MKTEAMVEIEWVDSCGFGASWEKKDDLERLEPSAIRSVGFMIEDTKRHKTIAQSTSVDQIAGRLCIPVACIKRIKRL